LGARGHDWQSGLSSLGKGDTGFSRKVLRLFLKVGGGWKHGSSGRAPAWHKALSSNPSITKKRKKMHIKVVGTILFKVES
jgi:hypothetical protein